MDNKNPANNTGLTPLHGAATNGHLEVCKYLMNKVDNKNPAENTGTTPLHCAADKGHLEICKFIASQIDSKNPANNQGTRPSQPFINTVLDLANDQLFTNDILDVSKLRNK